MALPRDPAGSEARPRVSQGTGETQRKQEEGMCLASSSASLFTISNKWSQLYSVLTARLLRDGTDQPTEAQTDRQGSSERQGKYVSLVNTAHTEKLVIPLCKFGLLPNTGWENHVAEG